VSYAKFFFFLIYSIPNSFSIVFNHGGEFMKEKDKVIYRGGKQTVVDGEKLDNWTRSHVHSLIMGWGYEKGSFKVYRRCMEGDDSFVKLTGDDDDYYSVACYIVDGGGTT
jgi:hypothetical protein